MVVTGKVRRIWLLAGVMIGGIALGLLIFVWASKLSLRPGQGAAPLDQSSFLRDVVEPITIVDAMSFDDGGSQGLRFSDAKGIIRDVCLENTLVWEDDPHVLEGHRNLLLDTFFPHGDKARRVPIYGVDERALLGLLERWVSQDADAKELDRREKLLEHKEMTSEAFWEGLPDRSRMIQVAVSIARQLRARN